MPAPQALPTLLLALVAAHAAPAAAAAASGHHVSASGGSGRGASAHPGHSITTLWQRGGRHREGGLAVAYEAAVLPRGWRDEWYAHRYDGEYIRPSHGSGNADSGSGVGEALDALSRGEGGMHGIDADIDDIVREHAGHGQGGSQYDPANSGSHDSGPSDGSNDGNDEGLEELAMDVGGGDIQDAASTTGKVIQDAVGDVGDEVAAEGTDDFDVVTDAIEGTISTIGNGLESVTDEGGDDGEDGGAGGVGVGGGETEGTAAAHAGGHSTGSAHGVAADAIHETENGGDDRRRERDIGEKDRVRDSVGGAAGSDEAAAAAEAEGDAASEAAAALEAAHPHRRLLQSGIVTVEEADKDAGSGSCGDPLVKEMVSLDNQARSRSGLAALKCDALAGTLAMDSSKGQCRCGLCVLRAVPLPVLLQSVAVGVSMPETRCDVPEMLFKCRSAGCARGVWTTACGPTLTQTAMAYPWFTRRARMHACMHVAAVWAWASRTPWWRPRPLGDAPFRVHRVQGWCHEPQRLPWPLRRGAGGRLGRLRRERGLQPPAAPGDDNPGHPPALDGLHRTPREHHVVGVFYCRLWLVRPYACGPCMRCPLNLSSSQPLVHVSLHRNKGELCCAHVAPAG